MTQAARAMVRGGEGVVTQPASSEAVFTRVTIVYD